MAAVFPPLAAIPPLTLHESTKREELDASKAVSDWLASLQKATTEKNSSSLTSLFFEKESWWRDFVVLTWDIACENGADAITKLLTSSKAGLSQLKVDTNPAMAPNLVNMGGMLFVQSGFTFKTDFGTGRGVLRLVNVGPNEWKAWTVFATLESLHGQTEVDMTTGKTNGTTDGTEKDLQVLVVGGSQSGLAIAAHLKHLDLNYLVVEKSSAPGEAWRERYQSIRSHTARYSDHYPFMDYPSDWPLWLDRDHIIDWMPQYAKALGLNIEYGVAAQNVTFEEASRRYSVELKGESGVRNLHTNHIVLATGLVSDIPHIPEFPGRDTFKGQVMHTSEYKCGSLIPDIQNKKITIIGSGTSGHDIAQDLVDHGAKSVTMVQRNPLYVLSLDSLEKFQLALWNTPGLSTNDADLLGNSFPTIIARTLGIGMSQMMAANDKELLDGLEKAGMAVKRGDKGDSLLDHQLILAGHFYIDQGASPMIVDGRIKVIHNEKGVTALYDDGVVIGDDQKLESDLVVIATGFVRSNARTESIMGKAAKGADISKMGALDDSQERVGWWRPTGAPGFWYMTGSFLWARQMVPILALQINAVERGVNKTHYNI